MVRSKDFPRDDRGYGDKVRMEFSHARDKWESKVDASPLRLDLLEQAVTFPKIMMDHVVYLL